MTERVFIRPCYWREERRGKALLGRRFFGYLLVAENKKVSRRAGCAEIRQGGLYTNSPDRKKPAKEAGFSMELFRTYSITPLKAGVSFEAVNGFPPSRE